MGCNDDDCMCNDDYYEDDDPSSSPCYFCGEFACDGSGYNCSDGHYQEYNLRGWETVS